MKLAHKFPASLKFLLAQVIMAAFEWENPNGSWAWHGMAWMPNRVCREPPGACRSRQSGAMSAIYTHGDSRHESVKFAK